MSCSLRTHEDPDDCPGRSFIAVVVIDVAVAGCWGCRCSWHDIVGCCSVRFLIFRVIVSKSCRFCLNCSNREKLDLLQFTFVLESISNDEPGVAVVVVAQEKNARSRLHGSTMSYFLKYLLDLEGDSGREGMIATLICPQHWLLKLWMLYQPLICFIPDKQMKWNNVNIKIGLIFSQVMCIQYTLDKSDFRFVSLVLHN